MSQSSMRPHLMGNGISSGIMIDGSGHVLFLRSTTRTCVVNNGREEMQASVKKFSTGLFAAKLHAIVILLSSDFLQ